MVYGGIRLLVVNTCMWSTIRRYWRLYKAFVRYTLARETTFRGDFLSYSFVNLLWAGFSLIVLGLFFTQTDSIAGWNEGEAFALLGTWHVVNAILTFFVRRNLSRLPDSIKDGKLDTLLVKPVNSQFIASLERIDLPKIFNLLFAIILLVFGLHKAGVDVTVWRALVYIILVGASVMIGYCVWFLLLTLSFRFIGMSNLEMLFDSMLRYGRFPADAFQVAGKVVLYTVVPFGVMTQIPSEVLARDPAWYWPVYAVCLAVALFALTVVLWNRQMAVYTSASS